MRRRRGMLLAAVVLLAAGCGGDDADVTEDTGAVEAEPPEEPAEPPEDPTEGAADEGGEAEEPAEAEEPMEDTAPDGEGDGAASAMLTLADTDLGEVLADGEGRILYLFDPDEEAGGSDCYDECAASWPPLEGPAEAGDGLDPDLVGTTERTDGTMQVTYGGWPLYYFSGDAEPGDTNGQGLQDVWWVVSAEGERVSDTAEAEASPAY